ncbi:hypothetical protein EWM64_g10177 [Hericium alpestre]|uniref:DUF659 domain-containing protein n=1 Tax=Hericium alpestre TaxID=135208 RepID=A0A4Y9ZGG5_9AGAM|nr:hypothetical protein EWM64_g10177 [Hericium alpestre]
MEQQDIDHGVDVEESDVNSGTGGKHKKGAAQPKAKRPDTKVLQSFEDKAYNDIPERSKRKSGAQQHPLVSKVSRHCTRARKAGNAENADGDADGGSGGDGEGDGDGDGDGDGNSDGENEDKSEGEDKGEDEGGGEGDIDANSDEKEKGKGKKKQKVAELRCCIASSKCKTAWSHSNLQRILKHAASCEYVPFHLHRAVLEALAKKAAGNAVAKSSSTGPLLPGSDTDTDDQPVAKRVKTAPAQSSTSKGGKASKGPMQAFVSEGKKQLKQKADHYLMLYLVCHGISIHTVKSQHLLDFCRTLNQTYVLPSKTTILDRLIPDEAARVSVAMMKYLRNCRNLTISYDGGKIRRPRGVYTINATTPERRSYLMDLVDVSCVSHTADYLVEIVKPVIKTIGPWNFSAVVSDNTGNTKKSRRLICDEYPNIINLQDPCHTINHAIGAICVLPEFSELISNVREVLAFMHESTYTMEQLGKKRADLGIKRGLEAIGKTRFSSVYWAVQSLERNMPAMRALVGDKSLGIDIKSRNELFTEGNYCSFAFRAQLAKFMAVTAPFARAIQCLESAHSTPADVFLFWLAIASNLEAVFKSGSVGLSEEATEQIRTIANRRFNEIINSSSCGDIYFAAFVLDPRFRDTPIYTRSSTLTSSGMSSNGAAMDDSLREKVLKRAGIALQTLLKNKYGDLVEKTPRQPHGKEREELAAVMNKRNLALAHLSPFEALTKLKQQLTNYVRGETPFDKPVEDGQSMRVWWERLVKRKSNIDAVDVLATLAVKIYSIVPNSMAEERTMSTITWLNSPQKNQLRVSTIKDEIIIQQYHEQEPAASPPKYRPTARWHDLIQAAIVQPKGNVGIVGSRSEPIPIEDVEDQESGWVDVPDDGETEGAEVGLVDHRWLNPNDTSQADPADRNGTAEQCTSFLVSMTDIIDISSPYLHAFLDETSVQPLTANARKVVKQQKVIEIPEGIDFDRWDK